MSKDPRECRSVWTHVETGCLISLIKQHNIIAELDRRKHRNKEVYKRLVPLMENAGFPRSFQQLRVKWKHLKVVYRKAAELNNAGGFGTATCPFYDEIHELLHSSPSASVAQPVLEDRCEDFKRSRHAAMDTAHTFLTQTPVSPKPAPLPAPLPTPLTALDDNDHFGNILVATLKRLPARTAAILRMKFTQELFSAEFGDDDDESVT